MAGDSPGSELVRVRWALVMAAALTISACAQSSEPASTAQQTKASGVSFDEIGIDEVRSATTVVVRETTVLGANTISGADLSENQVVSPWGAMVALQMLRAGAGGNTADELDAVIGSPEADATAALIGQLDRFDRNPGDVDQDNPPSPPVFHQATGVFVDEALTVDPDYLAILGRKFDTGVYPVDFAASDTEKAIDNWLAVNTGGEIDETPTEYTADTVISLLSTVYLAAAWQQPFAPETTKISDFTAADGSVGDVNMMRQTVTAGFLRGAGWRGLQLPYSDGLAMQVFLPEGGSDLAGLLDERRLTRASTDLRSATQSQVSVGLPRWDVAGTVDLKTVLERLGVRDLFTEVADLTAISPDLLVTAAVQDSTITVGEKGTVAASATQVDIGVTAMPPEEQIETFIADRPFVYQIIDTSTGLPLILGSINRPGKV